MNPDGAIDIEEGSTSAVVRQAALTFDGPDSGVSELRSAELDDALLVLHALCVAGRGGPADLAAMVGDASGSVASQLETLESDGLIRRSKGKASWSPTAAGRSRRLAAIKDELEALDCRNAVSAAYLAFIELNGPLLEICTTWQLRDGRINDHADGAYDAAVVSRLRALDRRLSPVVESLGNELRRFRPYRERFAAALRRLAAGESQWLDHPGLSSYHTVWFQLHEDLLKTLGIAREQERNRRTSASGA